MFEIICECPFCGAINTVEVRFEDYLDWQNGGLVQNCFPYLGADERELLMTGICENCWNMFFC